MLGAMATSIETRAKVAGVVDGLSEIDDRFAFVRDPGDRRAAQEAFAEALVALLDIADVIDAHS